MPFLPPNQQRQSTEGKMDEKLKKQKTCKKEQFSMFMLYLESNQAAADIGMFSMFA